MASTPRNNKLQASGNDIDGHKIGTQFSQELKCVRPKCVRYCGKSVSSDSVTRTIIQKFMRTDLSENWRRIKSLQVNEIYVDCSSKVNSRNNESTNTISFWANFSIYEYVINALLDDFSNLIFLGCAGTVANTGVFNGIIRRTLAARRIIKSREIGTDGNCVHRFIIPAVNFRAADYVDRIDWQACNVTPPAVRSHISCHVLLKMIQDDVPMDGRDFIKSPSHMQAVERIVKLVTEASRKRVGAQNRDGFIRATLESGKQMSQFESRKDYKK
ncbi:hypothetical protein AVEN_18469-1 [Araneus ventricosus]|uniref:Uncharacterized protein n=1 Tax=Araneus ventricosus TaxID=182803 RepID=A0A4Y2USM3_ARAVE|nr:hypothetical protein AVEN_18469-1 [Araneus ventricosus]